MFYCLYFETSKGKYRLHDAYDKKEFPTRDHCLGNWQYCKMLHNLDEGGEFDDYPPVPKHHKFLNFKTEEEAPTELVYKETK